MKQTKELQTQNIEQDESKYAILAGNFRVELSPTNEVIIVQPQLHAFKAALERANEIREKSGVQPLISVAFDHRGIFRTQFLKQGLTNSQKRKPRLSNLKEAIVKIVDPIVRETNSELDFVKVIHEDSARSHVDFMLNSGGYPKDVLRWITARKNDADCDQGCNTGSCSTQRITCAAITSEYFIRSTNHKTEILEVFIENDIWSSQDIYIRTSMLMATLGYKFEIILNLVDKKSGRVFRALKSNRASIQ